MGFSLHPQNISELGKEWELRSLTLLSLFLQLTLAITGSRRKSNSRYWIQFLVWTTYLLAESVATLTLGVLSNRLANIKEIKGTFDPKSQITAFWAPFLLLHLGGPDTITVYALADNQLWLRQLARLCFQVGLACYIYYMALLRSTLSMIAEGMILVGFIKYAEKTFCLYLASKDRLRDSMRSLPESSPIYPWKMEQVVLKRDEGYQVGFDEVIEYSAPRGILLSGHAHDNVKAPVEAYEFFQMFNRLFMGLIVNSGDLASSRRIFMGPDMDSLRAFRIVEIELGFMYDLLYTKAQLLNCTWGIIRWVTCLSVPCAVFVSFSLHDKKNYPKVDIYITFLLLSATILLEIYSLLLAISSDWVDIWLFRKTKRSTISSVITFLQFFPKQRWQKSVAQFSLLRFSNRKRNKLFGKYSLFTKLDKKVGKYFYVSRKEFKDNFKRWILPQMVDTIHRVERSLIIYPIHTRKSMAECFKQEARRVLALGPKALLWSMDGELDFRILIWHIATELCYHEDRGKMQGKISEDLVTFKMSKLVSRYMLYLLVMHPSMLPTGTGVFRYEDTLFDAQKFLEDNQAVLSKKEGSISTFIKRAQKLFKKEAHDPTGVYCCNKTHKSRESQDLCKVYNLLLGVKLALPGGKMRVARNESVLFDGCFLASQLKEQLKEVPQRWNVIGKVWASMLTSAAYESKGEEHLKSLSTGRELLSHVWLLMAHLGIVQPERNPEARRTTKLIVN